VRRWHSYGRTLKFRPGKSSKDRAKWGRWRGHTASDPRRPLWCSPRAVATDIGQRATDGLVAVGAKMEAWGRRWAYPPNGHSLPLAPQLRSATDRAQRYAASMVALERESEFEGAGLHGAGPTASASSSMRPSPAPGALKSSFRMAVPASSSISTTCRLVGYGPICWTAKPP
jgi:hypothetical protein